MASLLYDNLHGSNFNLGSNNIWYRLPKIDHELAKIACETVERQDTINVELKALGVVFSNKPIWIVAFGVAVTLAAIGVRRMRNLALPCIWNLFIPRILRILSLNRGRWCITEWGADTSS
jgi:hypothetical protein